MSYTVHHVVHHMGSPKGIPGLPMDIQLLQHQLQRLHSFCHKVDHGHPFLLRLQAILEG